MGSFSWIHFVLALFIIVLTAMGIYSYLVIIAAAIIAILSIFGVCSYGSKHRSYYGKKEQHEKKEVKAPMKRKKR